MSDCEVFKYAGIGNCDASRKPLRGFILTDKGTTITKANAGIIGADSTGWASILAPLAATSTYVKGTLIDVKRGYEVNTEAAEMTKSNLNHEDQTNRPSPKMTAYGKIGYDDYKTFFPAHGKTFDIVLINEDADPLMTTTSTAGTYKGFRGRIFVNKGDIPKPGADSQKDIEFRIIFDDPEEWENIIRVQSSFTYTQLNDVCPEGLNVEVTTDYVSPTVTFKVTYRGDGTNYADLSAAGTEIKIIQALNDATVAVASVDVTNAALGVYVATLTASLNGPVVAQITEESTNRDYLSNMFNIVA